MCGIAGSIGKNSSINVVKKMIDAIHYRGPDAKGFVEYQHISLGHARLSIIDLSQSADQPFIDSKHDLTLIYNGEIYNYLELKERLKEVYDFKTNSDTEVILAAYTHFGIEFLQHLEGMFAFALYDAKLQKTLLVRDRLGIKPLYYRITDNCFSFASEIKALLPLEKYHLNEEKVFEYLANNRLDCNEQTLFKEINQILPAHYVWIDSEGKMENPVLYWQLQKHGSRKFDEEAKNEFVELFTNTIKKHLLSDVKIGALLSGGLDSSSIVSFMSKINPEATLNVISGRLDYDHPENKLIDRIVEDFKNLRLEEFMLNGNAFFDDLPNVIYHQDEPFIDGSVYSHFKLCQLASIKEIKVLMSGAGGDEVFGGYASYIYSYLGQLILSVKIKKWNDELNNISENNSFDKKKLLINGLYETLPFSIREKIKRNKINQNYQHVTQVKSFKNFYYTNSNRFEANRNNVIKSWTLPPFLHYEDRNGMAFGVELRVPFLDHKLIDFISQFSMEDIMHGRTKSILRKSFKGIVPDYILNQKGKSSFPSPIDKALIHNKKGKEIFFKYCETTPGLNPKETKQLGIDFYNGIADLTIFWRTLCYIIWYDIFFGNPKTHTHSLSKLTVNEEI